IRQFRTPHSTLVIHIVGDSLRAVGGDDVDPVDDFGVSAMGSDEALDDVVTFACALGARHLQHLQLDFDVTEDNCAIAGHFYHPENWHPLVRSRRARETPGGYLP